MYEGHCAELCGVLHAVMPTTVEVLSQSEYESSLQLLTGQDQPGAAQLRLGRETWDGVCAKCHGLAGEGDLGPPIAKNGTLVDPEALTAILDNGIDTPGVAVYMPPVGRGWPDVRGAGADRVHQVERAARSGAAGASRPGLSGGPDRATVNPTWRDGRVTSWLTTVDHKRIGILYIVTAFFFFFAAGVMALLMRAQLAQADNDFITQNSYNQLFTIHGTAMVFLFVVPILAGFGNYLVPLMIGAKDMAFPRLNALSYWLFLLGGLIILSSFLADGGAANSGWTAYTPLSTAEFSPGIGQDLWILGLHLTSLSSLAGAINFIVTIHNMRTPGMTWMRIPLFVWSMEAYSVLLVLGAPDHLRAP